MSKKSGVLASLAIGGALTCAGIFLLSPKAVKALRKDAKNKLNELAALHPDALNFVKEKVQGASVFFTTFKDEIKKKEEEDFDYSQDETENSDLQSSEKTESFQDESDCEEIILSVDDLTPQIEG